MAKATPAIREKLFDLYRRNMAHYDPAVGDGFVCPLCKRVFPREMLGMDPPVLTLAHIVPDALGGTAPWGTLACAWCNNRVGTELEPALINKFRHEDWLASVGEMDARLDTGHGELGIQMKRGHDGSANGWEVRVVAGQSNPAEVERLQTWARENAGRPWQGEKFRFRWSVRTTPRRVQAALAHCAYLLLFRHFGYEILVDPRFDFLRELVAGKAPTQELQLVVMDDIKLSGCDRTPQQALLFLREPPAMMAVFRFRPRGGRERVIGVALPAPDADTTPTLTMKTLAPAHVAYVPEALADGPWMMRRLWAVLIGPAETTSVYEAL